MRTECIVLCLSRNLSKPKKPRTAHVDHWEVNNKTSDDAHHHSVPIEHVQSINSWLIFLECVLRGRAEAVGKNNDAPSESANEFDLEEQSRPRRGRVRKSAFAENDSAGKRGRYSNLAINVGVIDAQPNYSSAPGTAKVLRARCLYLYMNLIEFEGWGKNAR